jgi:hypothetical protein
VGWALASPSGLALSRSASSCPPNTGDKLQGSDLDGPCQLLLRHELSREDLSHAPARLILRRAIVTPAPSGRCADPRDRSSGGELRDAVDAKPSGYALDFKASGTSRKTGASCS